VRRGSHILRAEGRATRRVAAKAALVATLGSMIFLGPNCPLLSAFHANTVDRSRSASNVDSVSASFITSLGTHFGKGTRRDTCAPRFVCSSQTFASRSFAKRGASLTRAGQTPPMNISDFAVNQLADQNLGTFANGPRCSKNYAAFRCPHQLPGIGSPVIASARLGTGPRPAWSTTPCRSTKAVASLGLKFPFLILNSPYRPVCRPC